MPSYAKFYKALMTARIPDGAKIVFCALLDFQELPLSNPKIETLAKATGKGWKGVQHDLRWLRNSGLIQVRWGQRQSTYQIPENWPILLGRIRASEPDPVRPDPSIPLGRIRASEPAAPYLLQDSFTRREDYVKPSKLSTREEPAVSPPPAGPPARLRPRGVEGILQTALESVLSDGVRLPPRYLRNEYGRKDRNPASVRLEHALQNALPRILAARKPVAFTRKIILDELKGA